MIGDAIGESLTTKTEFLKKKARKYTKWGRYATKTAAHFFKPAEALDNVLARLEDVAASADTVALEELRGRLARLLSSTNKRIIILIDDVDRLDKSETYTLFRLIKACADFSNVCYVLAFDESAVSKALGERYGGGDEASGRAFLEKIIQIPLKLPAPAREDLRSLCFLQVDAALDCIGVELSREDSAKFVTCFERGALTRVDTPRAAKRYGNALLFSLPLLASDVNIVDLLLVEALRTFYPEVYHIVRNNQELFSGVRTKDFEKSDDGEIRGIDLIQGLVSELDAESQRAIKALISDLFPRVEGQYGRHTYGTGFLETWAAQRRICSPECCSRYFSYAVALNDISEGDFSELLRLANEGGHNPVIAFVEKALKSGKSRRLIERLRSVEGTTSPQAAKAFSNAIAGLASLLPNPQSFFNFADPPSQAAILIANLMARVPAGDERVLASKRIMEACNPIWFAAQCFRWLQVPEGPENDRRPILTDQEVEGVGRHLVARIKEYAANGAALFSVDNIQEQELLYTFRRFEGRPASQEHLQSVFSRDTKQISLFLWSMTPRSFGSGDYVPRRSRLDGDQVKNIKFLIDLDVIEDLVRRHMIDSCKLSNDFEELETPTDQRLAERFLAILDDWRKNGEPPDRIRENPTAL